MISVVARNLRRLPLSNGSPLLLCQIRSRAALLLVKQSLFGMSKSKTEEPVEKDQYEVRCGMPTACRGH